MKFSRNDDLICIFDQNILYLIIFLNRFSKMIRLDGHQGYSLVYFYAYELFVYAIIEMRLSLTSSNNFC
jgi:hypothetical protein